MKTVTEEINKRIIKHTDNEYSRISLKFEPHCLTMFKNTVCKYVHSTGIDL